MSCPFAWLGLLVGLIKVHTHCYRPNPTGIRDSTVQEPGKRSTSGIH